MKDDARQRVVRKLTRAQLTGSARPSPPRYDYVSPDHAKADSYFAAAYLYGDSTKEKTGLSKRQPIARHREKDARTVFARLLRSDEPLDRSLRDALADLVDPESQAPLEIKIVRRRGRPPRESDYQIAEEVWEAITETGLSVGQALEYAARKFGYGDNVSSVQKMWLRAKPTFEGAFGKPAERGKI